ncbi:MAG TPA: putative toxin-antitoxin system toxin component, PIN family [Pirellulales bacterium]|nr:putative toxin-antitoxin system toxin component, PIN family [Pirellulales bacterium]
MNVVVDTNILVRAAPGRTGPARELLQLLAEPPHVLVSSPPLLDELSRALGYPRLRAIHGLDDAGIMRYATDIETLAMLVPLTTPTVTAVQSDPDDNAVVAAAIAGQAEVICTRVGANCA